MNLQFNNNLFRSNSSVFGENCTNLSESEKILHIKKLVKNKRLASIDFGLERVGIAVCDALHISITPKDTLLLQKQDFWNQLIKILTVENIGGIIVGIPCENSNKNEQILNGIEFFLSNLSKLTILPIFLQDESFSSKQAVNLMLKIGTKKKTRSKKGTTDKFAAAIILRNFLESIE